jgi:hypothetical protein
MYIDNKPEEEHLSTMKLEKCLVIFLLNCIYSEKLRVQNVKIPDIIQS